MDAGEIREGHVEPAGSVAEGGDGSPGVLQPGGGQRAGAADAGGHLVPALSLGEGLGGIELEGQGAERMGQDVVQVACDAGPLDVRRVLGALALDRDLLVQESPLLEERCLTLPAQRRHEGAGCAARGDGRQVLGPCSPGLGCEGDHEGVDGEGAQDQRDVAIGTTHEPHDAPDGDGQRWRARVEHDPERQDLRHHDRRGRRPRPERRVGASARDQERLDHAQRDRELPDCDGGPRGALGDDDGEDRPQAE